MIRVGIGGWTYEPWRGTFYPADLKQADELDYASRHLTTIEINGTFYRTQSAASFRKWRDATPDDFVFAVKGHRNCRQQPQARRGGRGDRLVLQERRPRARRETRPRALAVRAVQEIRRSGLRRLPDPAAAQGRRSRADACGRGQEQELRRPGVHRASARAQCRRGLRRLGRASGDRRRDRRLRLRPAAADEGGERDRLCRRRP